MDKVIRDALRWRFIRNYYMDGSLHLLGNDICVPSVIDEGIRYEELAGIAGVVFWSYSRIDQVPTEADDLMWYEAGKKMYDSAMRISPPKEDS